jgi:hypothetical protein
MRPFLFRLLRVLLPLLLRPGLTLRMFHWRCPLLFRVLRSGFPLRYRPGVLRSSRMFHRSRAVLLHRMLRHRALPLRRMEPQR